MISITYSKNAPPGLSLATKYNLVSIESIPGPDPNAQHTVIVERAPGDLVTVKYTGDTDDYELSTPDVVII